MEQKIERAVELLSLLGLLEDIHQHADDMHMLAFLSYRLYAALDDHRLVDEEREEVYQLIYLIQEHFGPHIYADHGLLTVAEAAIRLHLSPQAIYHAIEREQMIAYSSQTTYLLPAEQWSEGCTRSIE